MRNLLAATPAVHAASSAASTVNTFHHSFLALTALQAAQRAQVRERAERRRRRMMMSASRARRIPAVQAKLMKSPWRHSCRVEAVVPVRSTTSASVSMPMRYAQWRQRPRRFALLIRSHRLQNIHATTRRSRNLGIR